MDVKVQVTIDKPKEDVWRVITDIENAHNNVTGIEKVEVLEKPNEGLVGLKWRETRTMFGKKATEIMWITDATQNDSYRTRAESHGSVYVSTLALAEEAGKTRLSMRFDAEPQTLGAKLMAAATGRFFKNATVKALTQDLNDIKAAVERS